MKKYESSILQVADEMDEYCDILRKDGVHNYLEIGSKFGGSLWRAASALPVGARIVAVDLPNGTKAWKDSRVSLEECIQDLRALGYDARVIWGDSQSREVIRQVELWGPYDGIMIDADHRLPGVAADWTVYGPMSRSIVAFHDIAWRRAPEWEGVRIDVPEFWNSIKDQYHHVEIKRCPTGKNNGIGVLWR
jgi:predicted O-methyltransferase YrrM